MSAVLDLSEHLTARDGFCRPNWDAISAFIESRLPEADWKRAWDDVARQWVHQLRGDLSGEYRVIETPNFLILTTAPERIAHDACKSYEAALKHIVTSLRGVASDQTFKQVVLMFAEMDDYYRYISYFYSDGEHPTSGGVCLSGAGYIHYAFPTPDYSCYRTTLVHELTHGCLAHLPLPVWLNEGLAMHMEQVVCGSDIFVLDREVYDRHLAHWTSDTIQEFWSGESWEIAGDSFELSYNLAQVIWRKIQVDTAKSREDLLRFIGTADFADAGEAACQSIFKTGLGDLAADFLGEGNWTPDSARWAASSAETKE